MSLLWCEPGKGAGSWFETWIAGGSSAHMFDFVTYRIVSCNVCSRSFTIFEMIVCDHGMAWTLRWGQCGPLDNRYRDIGWIMEEKCFS